MMDRQDLIDLSRLGIYSIVQIVFGLIGFGLPYHFQGRPSYVILQIVGAILCFGTGFLGAIASQGPGKIVGYFWMMAVMVVNALLFALMVLNAVLLLVEIPMFFGKSGISILVYLPMVGIFCIFAMIFYKAAGIASTAAAVLKVRRDIELKDLQHPTEYPEDDLEAQALDNEGHSERPPEYAL